MEANELHEKVKLKNGVEGYTRGQVSVMWWVLKRLLGDQPILFYELVMRCRDGNHVFFGETGPALQKLNLLDSNMKPHGMVRDIVLSGVTGNGLEMELGSAIAL